MTEETIHHYDVEEAAKTVAGRTGQKIELVEEILEAEFLFNAALGVYEIPDDDDGREFMAEIETLRKKHADLIPAADADIEEIEDIDDRLVSFVERLTSASKETVEEVLDSHFDYLEENGMLEPIDDD